MPGEMQPGKKLVIEVCVDSVESAVAAERGGADRVELCDNLLEGGTTPSAGAIDIARRRLGIKMHVIIRPRGGDFCYSEVEFEIMKRDIQIARSLGADGVVIGILTPDGEVDLDCTRELIALARPMSVTFHRAFDMTRDPFAALESLIVAGVDRILTSGQEPSVVEGLDLIAELVQRAAGRVIVMPGGGTERNLPKVLAATGVPEVHVIGVSSVESPMRFRNTRVFMGGELRPAEYARAVTDPAKIAALRAAAQESTGRKG
jgi:copper homeostasis protein